MDGLTRLFIRFLSKVTPSLKHLNVILLIALEKKNSLDNRGTKLEAVGFDLWRETSQWWQDDAN
jgi:hypothetical protein